MLHTHPGLEKLHCIPDNFVMVDREDHKEALCRLSLPLHVTLSKRNLLALLHKLEMPDSTRTIVKLTPEGNVFVSVISDEEAYCNRPAGPMHPETEQFIVDAEVALSIVRELRERQVQSCKSSYNR